MRIMRIGTPHPDYLACFSARCGDTATFAERMRRYLDDYYRRGRTLTPALERMGHETFFRVPSDLSGQPPLAPGDRLSLDCVVQEMPRRLPGHREQTACPRSINSLNTCIKQNSYT